MGFPGQVQCDQKIEKIAQSGQNCSQNVQAQIESWKKLQQTAFKGKLSATIYVLKLLICVKFFKMQSKKQPKWQNLVTLGWLMAFSYPTH
jgi:hypothetical protein